MRRAQACATRIPSLWAEFAPAVAGKRVIVLQRSRLMWSPRPGETPRIMTPVLSMLN
jgi:hypothetical protein